MRWVEGAHSPARGIDEGTRIGENEWVAMTETLIKGKRDKVYRERRGVRAAKKGERNGRESTASCGWSGGEGALLVRVALDACHPRCSRTV